MYLNTFKFLGWWGQDPPCFLTLAAFITPFSFCSSSLNHPLLMHFTHFLRVRKVHDCWDSITSLNGGMYRCSLCSTRTQNSGSSRMTHPSQCYSNMDSFIFRLGLVCSHWAVLLFIASHILVEAVLEWDTNPGACDLFHQDKVWCVKWIVICHHTHYPSFLCQFSSYKSPTCDWYGDWRKYRHFLSFQVLW